MTEYVTVIEVWYEAADDEEAKATAVFLSKQVLDHPKVVQVEVQVPEEA